ncbi:MAG: SpoIIE family protein phosphatase [Planctomycetes bacterium]|nr:SpoIIE family protein phosphatase [Planctomycetota bacterium]
MPRVDLSANPKIPQIIELFEVTSSIRDPVLLQREYATRIRRIQHSTGYIALSVRDLPRDFYRITRVTLDSAAPAVWQDNWKMGHTLPLYTGGFLGEIVATPEPKLFHHLRVTDDPVLGDLLTDMGSAMAIPLYDAGKVQNWGVIFRKEPEGYSQQELEDQLMRGNLVGGMVKNLVNVRRIEELNETLNHQMQQVAAIQRSLIPQVLPDLPGLSLAASYVTSNQAGGDYYDFFDMGNGRSGVVVADVSGHGAGAATVMAMLQTILHDFQERDKGPAAMLRHANRSLLRKNLDGSFVTAFMGVFDPERRVFEFANAGHLNPAVRTPHAGVREIHGIGGVPLGVLDDAEYDANAATVAPGETVVLYTDGITEAFSPPPEKQMFGIDRLKRAVADSPPDPPGVIDAIHASVHEHTQTFDRADDQTIVAMRVDS